MTCPRCWGSGRQVVWRRVDLTPERLDELERDANRKDGLGGLMPLVIHPDDALDLIAMAQRTEAAERERDIAIHALATTVGAELSDRLLNGDDPDPRPYTGILGGDA